MKLCKVITISCLLLCFFTTIALPLLWLAGLFLKRERPLLKFIKYVNLPLLFHIFVLLTYAAGEFSILSGWEFVQSAIESEIKVTPKTLMAAFFAVLVPVALFFMSIIFGYTSYARIQHPEEVLYDKEYGLRKFYDEKTEGSETNTEIDAELSPQGGEEPYWKEPPSDANPKMRGIPFWKSKKTKTEEAKVFWLDYANYIFAKLARPLALKR